MATLSKDMLTGQQENLRITPALGFVLFWHGLVGTGLFFGAAQLWQITQFFNLGNFVPRFLAMVVGLLGAASFITIPLLVRNSNNGRLIGILLNFFGMTLAILYFGHLIGLYIGIDFLAAGIFRNSTLLLGLPIGYAIVWIGRRLDEGMAAHDWLQRIGLGVMMLTVMALLIASGLVTSVGTLLNALSRLDVLATLAIGSLFAVAGVLLLRMGPRFGETILQREAWQGWLFLLPNFVNFLLFFAMPLILSFYLSFTNYDAVRRADFIGFDNYTRMLSLDIVTVPAGTPSTGVLRQNHFEVARITLGDTAIVFGGRDPLFWQSLGTTIRYCIFLLILSIIPALGLAMLLNSKIPGMRFFRAIYFLPSIAAVVGIALIWQWLYDPIIGYINYTITQVVTFLNTTFGFSITDPQIQWLTDDNVMLYSAVIMAAWQVVGFNTVILLAGLQGVPRELLEASTVDGAGPWTRFRRIILPLLAPTTFFVTVTTLIAGLQAFTEMFVLFGNSTSNARLTTVFYLYQQGFQRFQMGYASATAWVLFAVIFTVTLIQFRLSSSNRAYAD